MSITTPENIAVHVRNLQYVGDLLESDGDPHWLPVAQAAALLEGLRLGIVTIDSSAPRFAGQPSTTN